MAQMMRSLFIRVETKPSKSAFVTESAPSAPITPPARPAA